MSQLKDNLQSSSNSPALGRQEVLIVDDDQRTATALAAILRDAGFGTTVFYTGGDAIRHAKKLPVAAVILDVHLPDLNGLVLAKSLREQLGPAVPIFVMSGDTSMETLNSLSLVGATHFFAKPMSPSYVIERLRDALGPAN